MKGTHTPSRFRLQPSLMLLYSKRIFVSSSTKVQIYHISQCTESIHNTVIQE